MPRLPMPSDTEAFRVSDRLSDSDRAALMGESLTQIHHWEPSHA